MKKKQPNTKEREMKVHQGYWATFSEKDIVNLKRARTLLEKANYNSCCNNRDTAMIEGAVEIIDQVINFQYKKHN
jgi:hypothetical protein